MIIRSIQSVAGHPYSLHFHVLTTSTDYAIVALEGNLIEVFQGEVPYKEIDDLLEGTSSRRRPFPNGV